MPLSTVTVTGAWLTAANTPATGRVRIEPVTAAAGGGFIVAGVAKTEQLAAGSISTTVVSNAQAATLQYKITEAIDGVVPPPPPYYITPSGTTLDLSTAPRGTGTAVPMAVLLDATGKVAVGQLPVGTATGTIAAGDDARLVGNAKVANNLSDLASAATARTNLALGNVDNTADTAKPVSTAQQTALNAKLAAASNLSDVAVTATARTNLGLGGAATLNVGTTTGTVTAGDDARLSGNARTANNLTDLASAATALTNLGGLASATRGAANGVASLDANSKIPIAQQIDPYALAVGESTSPRDLVTNLAANSFSGRLALQYFTATKTETITQVKSYSAATAAAATPTLCRYGVYSEAANGDLTLIASTANDTTLWSVIWTAYPKTLSAPWSKVAGQRYAIGLLIVNAGVCPDWMGYSVSGATLAGTIRFQNPKLHGRVDSLTDLPSTVTNATIGQSPYVAYVEMLP